MDMTQESCRAFVAAVASRAPAPGGGGGAALVGAIGTALGHMAGALTVGKPARMDNPELLAAIARVLAACKANGKLSMIYAGDAAGSARLFRQGFDCVACGMDSILLIQAAKQLKADVEALL